MRFARGWPSEDALNAPSWHGNFGELGRPTVFADGHAAVLKTPAYLRGQALFSANATHVVDGKTVSLHEYVNQSKYPSSQWQAADYAISEY